jgi:hypothetical protein
MSKPLSFEDALELYLKMLATQPEVERKGKEKLPHTSINTWMFSMVSKDGRVGMRLPDAKRAEFNEKYNTGDYKNYGATIREYSEIPPELLANTAELAPWFAASYEYTKSLKPKPAKKK